MVDSIQNVRIPSHLSGTLRYKQYKWNKKSDLMRVAKQVACGQKEVICFLNEPIKWSGAHGGATEIAK